jgi:hypothetical protein
MFYLATAIPFPRMILRSPFMAAQNDICRDFEQEDTENMLPVRSGGQDKTL